MTTETPETPTPPTELWAVVELMGHRQRAGRISQVEAFGTQLLRVEIPTPDGDFVTEDYGGASIYGVRYCDEDFARCWVLQRGDPRPTRPTSYLPALAAPGSHVVDLDDDDVNF